MPLGGGSALEPVVLGLARPQHDFVFAMQRHRRLVIGQVEGRLADRLGRVGESEPCGHRMVEADEAAAGVLEVDRVRNAAQQAVEEISLVEQRVLRRLEPADVDQREHDAFGGALGAIGEQAQEERLAAQIDEVALDRLPGRQHAPQIFDQLRVTHLVREGLDRPADVVRQQAEGVGDLRRELADPQLSVEEDRADVGAGQQVVHVVGQLGQLGDLPLVLGVDRVELLVDALQLFVRALQLFVRRLQLLVRGLQLLVARLELFDGRLQAFLRRSQLGFECRELLLRDLIDVDLNRWRVVGGSSRRLGDSNETTR